MTSLARARDGLPKSANRCIKAFSRTARPGLTV